MTEVWAMMTFKPLENKRARRIGLVLFLAAVLVTGWMLVLVMEPQAT